MDRIYAEGLFLDLLKDSTNQPLGRGVTRMAYSFRESRAHDRIQKAAAEHGLIVSEDAALNTIVRLPDASYSTGIVALGSHLDSVPNGGNFDGAAGVVAGLMCLVKARKERPELPLMLVAFRCEEGAWFGKSCIGSAAFTGQFEEEWFNLPLQINAGLGLKMSLRECIENSSPNGRPERIVTSNWVRKGDLKNLRAFLELHIEQGPVLEHEKMPLGVVTQIDGVVRFPRVVCKGEWAHSGTTPRGYRRDALMASANMILELNQAYMDKRFTVGVFDGATTEHAVSKVAGQVSFSLELRTQDQDEAEEFIKVVQGFTEPISKAYGVTFDLGHSVTSEPTKMDEEVQTKFLESMPYPTLSMSSGAGHDAASFAKAGVPTGMLFVRNQFGSHNPDEDMRMEDFHLGTEVLYTTAVKLAGEK